MSREPVSAVLSDTLVSAIAKRRVKAAVFLTFQFDPGFFEEEILPLLFDQSFSHVPQLRLVQLEEALRSIEHLGVYYDRNGLTADAKPARLDYRRIGLHRQTGCFHPKNVFLLLENQNGDEYEESLLFATLSANLTRSGWWENKEVAYITEVRSGEKCAFRRELLDLISRLKQEDHTLKEHPALESIHTFTLKSIEDSGVSQKQGRLLPRLYSGQKNVPEFLSQFIETDTYNLDIVSPYFDGSAKGQTLPKLIEWLRPKETRLFLPKANDGTANCNEELYSQIAKLPRVRWGLLPDNTAQTQNNAEPGIAQRFVHAKVYRFWNQSREILFLGSVNLTSAAHSPGNAGNFETGMLVETKVSGQQNWWLQPLAENIPTDFRDVSVEEADIDEPPCVVSFCFDWENETLTYFWEAATAPNRVVVLAQNVPKFTITLVQLNKWTTLPAEAAQALKELLKSTSLLEVCADDGLPFRVLVREEGMAHKPALFLSLTPEEILHYWSLLSPEQREQFLAHKALIVIDGFVHQESMTSPIRQGENSMFDRFAGIFHAFGRLESHIREALDAEHETEAVYRLLGEKHDSLPSLLDKVIKNEEGDRVHRYVTLLCAKQLIDRIEKDFIDFKNRNRSAFNRLREKLAEIDRIEAGFTFESPEIRTEFFAWFREMFLRPAKLPQTEEAI